MTKESRWLSAGKGNGYVCQVPSSSIIISGQEQIKATEQSSLIYTQKETEEERKYSSYFPVCCFCTRTRVNICVWMRILNSRAEKRKKKSFIAFVVVVGVSFSCNMLPAFKLHCCCCCFFSSLAFFNAIRVRRKADKKKKTLDIPGSQRNLENLGWRCLMCLRYQMNISLMPANDIFLIFISLVCLSPSSLLVLSGNARVLCRFTARWILCIEQWSWMNFTPDTSERRERCEIYAVFGLLMKQFCVQHLWSVLGALFMVPDRCARGWKKISELLDAI